MLKSIKCLLETTRKCSDQGTLWSTVHSNLDLEEEGVGGKLNHRISTNKEEEALLVCKTLTIILVQMEMIHLMKDLNDKREGFSEEV
mmetsp:Transcript_2758/g.4645  ORF Transcript_2758/g.4645 Transcript_2758/m.4645 type:complete len:87 (+) Transcript_2758:160-420(+)